MATYGVCESHVDLHPFRNDPDPCYGFRTAVLVEELDEAIERLATRGVGA